MGKSSSYTTESALRRETDVTLTFQQMHTWVICAEH